MKGIPTLYIDQYGSQFRASTLRELRSKLRGRCSKMYVDGKNGEALHIGYVIGHHWLTAYRRAVLS